MLPVEESQPDGARGAFGAGTRGQPHLVASQTDPAAAGGHSHCASHIRGCGSVDVDPAAPHATCAPTAVLLQPPECGSHHLHW